MSVALDSAYRFCVEKDILHFLVYNLINWFSRWSSSDGLAFRYLAIKNSAVVKEQQPKAFLHAAVLKYVHTNFKWRLKSLSLTNDHFSGLLLFFYICYAQLLSSLKSWIVLMIVTIWIFEKANMMVLFYNLKLSNINSNKVHKMTSCDFIPLR